MAVICYNVSVFIPCAFFFNFFIRIETFNYFYIKKKYIILSLNKTLNSSYGSAITPASPLETVFVLDYAKFKHSLTTCIR